VYQYNPDEDQVRPAKIRTLYHFLFFGW